MVPANPRAPDGLTSPCTFGGFYHKSELPTGAAGRARIGAIGAEVTGTGGGAGAGGDKEEAGPT